MKTKKSKKISASKPKNLAEIASFYTLLNQAYASGAEFIEFQYLNLEFDSPIKVYFKRSNGSQIEHSTAHLTHQLMQSVINFIQKNSIWLLNVNDPKIQVGKLTFSPPSASLVSKTLELKSRQIIDREIEGEPVILQVYF